MTVPKFSRTAMMDTQAAEKANIWAIKTWRYLRLAMVGLTIGLGVAILYEHVKTPSDCWQPSISAYYYTPVQAFFVGTLVTIGVSLIALKGNTEIEDNLLNLAGTFAPFVALVPTPDPGHCGSVLSDTTNRDVNISNNIVALLAVGFLALVTLAGLTINGARRNQPSPNRVGLLGFAISTVLWAVTVWLFSAHRHWFTAHGHSIAATLMFLFIFLNVCFNAYNLHHVSLRSGMKVKLLNRYTWTAILMAIAVVANLWARLVDHWAYWVLGLESSFILLFMIFWLLQSVELWDYGLRPAVLRQTPPAPQALSN